MTPESNAQTAAATIAAELGQPTRGKGVDRLAAALVEAVNADITEQEAAARLAKLPGARWVYTSVNVGYSIPTVRDNFDQIEYVANVDVIDGPTFRESSPIGLLPCVEAIEAKFSEQVRKANREKTIRARIERELAEIEAAEKADQATAPLEFRPDGSPADVLPVIVQGGGPEFDHSKPLMPQIEARQRELLNEVDPFDGVTPADGGGVA